MKKIICIFVLFMLLISLFSACSGDSGDKASSAPADNSGTATDISVPSVDINHPLSGVYMGTATLTDFDDGSMAGTEGSTPVPIGTESPFSFTISMMDDTMATVRFQEIEGTGESLSIPIFLRDDGSYSGSVYYTETSCDEISFTLTEKDGVLSLKGTFKIILDDQWMLQTLQMTKTADLEG